MREKTILWEKKSSSFTRNVFKCDPNVLNTAYNHQQSDMMFKHSYRYNKLNKLFRNGHRLK